MKLWRSLHVPRTMSPSKTVPELISCMTVTSVTAVQEIRSWGSTAALNQTGRDVTRRYRCRYHSMFTVPCSKRRAQPELPEFRREISLVSNAVRLLAFTAKEGFALNRRYCRIRSKNPVNGAPAHPPQDQKKLRYETLHNSEG